jgi:hypothetical protein
LAGEAVAAVELEPFVPGLLPCSVGAGSGAGGGASGVLFRSLCLVSLQLFPLVWSWMQAELLVAASEFVLTAGVDRGGAPADVPSASSRARRPRRVATAASSKRPGPPKIQSGDLAAAMGFFVSPSGDFEAALMAVADLVHLRGARELGCIFFVFQGFFCMLGTAVPVLVVSCIFVFLI